MKFEDLQNQWQKEGGNAAVQISYDVLLKEIKRSKNYLNAMIFWRDMREVVVGLGLTVLFLYFGIKGNSWTAYLMSSMALFVSLFFIIDRIRFRKWNPCKEDSLLGCVENSLAQVNHQIWLLRNIFWWYLLPLLFGIVVSFAYVEIHIKHTLLHETKTILQIALSLSRSLVPTGAIFAGVYWLNQWAVREELLPRKEELENLLKSLENEK